MSRLKHASIILSIIFTEPSGFTKFQLGVCVRGGYIQTPIALIPTLVLDPY